MELIAEKFGYKFWQGANEDGKPFYNITPHFLPAPIGGYMNSDYICKIKEVPNLFKK